MSETDLLQKFQKRERGGFTVRKTRLRGQVPTGETCVVSNETINLDCMCPDEVSDSWIAPGTIFS